MAGAGRESPTMGLEGVGAAAADGFFRPSFSSILLKRLMIYPFPILIRFVNSSSPFFYYRGLVANGNPIERWSRSEEFVNSKHFQELTGYNERRIAHSGSLTVEGDGRKNPDSRIGDQSNTVPISWIPQGFLEFTGFSFSHALLPQIAAATCSLSKPAKSSLPDDRVFQLPALYQG